MNSQLAEREDTYYRQWMALGGENRPLRWSKRRAMFWGLLMAQTHDAAYERGRAVGPRIGQPLTVASGSDLVLPWFFGKAVVAAPFAVQWSGQDYTIQERPGHPWAPLLLRMARCLGRGVLDPGLPASLPPTASLPVASAAQLLATARQAFGQDALPAVQDVLASNLMEAREFRQALTRGDTGAAWYWFSQEWSLRAKEPFRREVVDRDGHACACCRRRGVRLQLHHRRKVRDWGRTVPDNLEALCGPCHTAVEDLGHHCHPAVARAR